MNTGTTLMCKDIEVLHFNLDDGVYEILDEQHLPYQLKGKVFPLQEPKEMFTSIEEQKRFMKEYLITANKNHNAVESYCASRVLSLTRENAKKIYNLFGYEQLQDNHSKALVSILCRSVSLQDDYWIRNDNETIKKTWKDIDIRQNSLSEIVAMVALHGSSLTLQGEAHTPELNGQGAYAKAWLRENDDLYLYKLGANGGDYESHLEVMVSNLLDKTNIPHILYQDAMTKDRYACKCQCMTTEDISILPGVDFISYCHVHELNPDREIMKIDSDMIYKMWITDYLISNRDRHGMNWGFFYNANTMEITGCHPLFDHNNAFDKELMNDENALSLFNRNKTMKELAKYAMNRTEIKIIEPITKNDFMTDEQYQSFKDKAEYLGIEIAPKRQITNPFRLILKGNQNNDVLQTDYLENGEDEYEPFDR